MAPQVRREEVAATGEEAFAAVVFGLGAFAVAIWRARTATPALV